jgi:hypothetical protein
MALDQAAWDDASNQINAWKDKSGPQGNINWESARSIWEGSGGDLGAVYGQANNWVNQPQAQAAPQQKAAAQPFNYDQFYSGWLNQGFGNQTSKDALAQHAAKWGVTIKGGDKAYAPDGSYLGDLIGDLDTENKVQFLRGAEGHATAARARGQKAPAPKPKPLPKPAPGGGGGGGGAPAGGGGGGSYTTPNMGSQGTELFNLLMERAKGSENVDPNDPIIKAQTDAYRSEGVNARRDFLAQQAEAGGPYGNLRSEERRSAEQLGKSVGGFQAGAMQQELTARRAKIEHALDQGAAFLTDQQRMALQNELTRLQLAQQESQFGRDLGFRNKQLAQQGSQFNRSLSQADSHFGRSLGQRAYEYDTSRWDDIFL